jgi:hypothetical protein
MIDEETKLREDIATANAADDALRLIGGTFAKLEAEYVAAWKATPVRDAEARERLWQAVQIVGKVEAHLRALAANRPLAAHQLAEIARMGERKKRFGIV